MDIDILGKKTINSVSSIF